MVGEGSRGCPRAPQGARHKTEDRAQAGGGHTGRCRLRDGEGAEDDQPRGRVHAVAVQDALRFNQPDARQGSRGMGPERGDAGDTQGTEEVPRVQDEERQGRVPVLQGEGRERRRGVLHRVQAPRIAGRILRGQPGRDEDAGLRRGGPARPLPMAPTGAKPVKDNRKEVSTCSTR